MSNKNSKNGSNINIESKQNYKERFVDPVRHFIRKIPETPYKILIFSFIFLFIVFLFYLYMFNPFDILNIFPRFTLLLSIIIFFYLSYICAISLEDDTKYNIINENISQYFIGFAYLCVFFVFFCVFYYVFKKVLLFSASNSTFLVLIFSILFLSIFYSLNKNIKKTSNIFLNMILIIPCLIVDSYEYLSNDIKDAPSSTLTLSVISMIIFFIYILFPYIHKFKKNNNTLTLLSEKKNLGNEVVYISHDELNKKIISKKPFYKREIIKQKELLEKLLKKEKKENEKIMNESLRDRKIYKQNGLNDYTLVKDIKECMNKRIECDGSNNIICVNDTNENYIVTNDHNMYQKCKVNNSLSNLFSNEESQLTLYSNKTNEEDDDNIVLQSFNEYCSKMNDYKFEVDCLNYQDISNQIVDSSFISENEILLNNEIENIFVCKKLDISFNDNQYDLIYGFTDICKNEQKYFKCNNNYKRQTKKNRNPFYLFENISHLYAYNDKVHKLDYNIQYFDFMKLLDQREKDIIEKSMIKDDSSIKKKLQQISDASDYNKLYEEYLSSNDSYNTILSTIHEVNTMKDEYINQKASNLVNTLNRIYKIKDFNYHYCLSFWIYFDPEILKTDQSNYEGLIMNYSYTPYIYYHYHTKQLVVETNKCHADVLNPNDINCYEREVIYKTSNILYQRWNLFVINYDYGTLDIFINNRLVSTKDKIAPYIQKTKNILQFGSTEKPLKSCGICNIQYYEEPLNLKKINKLYENKLNPCK